MTKFFILYISGMQVAVALGETVIKLEEVSHLVLTSSVPEIVSSPNWYCVTDVPALSFLAIVLIIESSPSCRPQLLGQEAVQRRKEKDRYCAETPQTMSDLQCFKSLSHPMSLQIQRSYKHLTGLMPSVSWDEGDAVGEVKVSLPKYSYSWFGSAADFCSVCGTVLLPNALATSKQFCGDCNGQRTHKTKSVYWDSIFC